MKPLTIRQGREQEEDQREVCMYCSIGEGLPSDAGGPRFDPECPLFHQIHAIYEVYGDM